LDHRVPRAVGDSWFLDRSGQNRQAWPGSSIKYWRHTRGRSAIGSTCVAPQRVR